MEVELQSFLSSAQHGGVWSATLPYPFTSRIRGATTHRIRGWVGPTTSLDDFEKRKKLLLLPGIEPRVVQPVVQFLY
jgi:hypothetical protein